VPDPFKLAGMELAMKERWRRAAAGWEKRADWFREQTMPVSAWMVEAIAPQPGQTILDLAAGIGDTGFLAAELLKPGGTLVTADFSPDMLSAAQRRAEQLGIANVRFRQMDANLPLDQPAATLDGVLCRWGYMLLNDGEDALRETRRILKPGAAVALAAWTGPEENRWSTATSEILRRRGLIDPPDPNAPGQFAWAAPGAVQEHMEAAGFVEPRVERLPFPVRYANVDEWWLSQTLTNMAVSLADEQLDFATRSDVLAELEQAAEPYEQPDGTLLIPAATWVATATA
jgi:ubiquinone/menaquinone biosynthesis C-methylase UbiE